MYPMDSTGRERYLGKVSTHRKLTNFALAESSYSAGQTLSWHSHERAFISIALQGSYTEQWSSSTLYCRAGQVIFHVAGEEHCNRFFGQGARSLNLEIMPAFLERLKDLGMRTDARIAFCSSRFALLGLRMYAEACRYDSGSEFMIEGLAMELLGELLRRQDEGLSTPSSDWLEFVRDIIHERYREPLSLRELAAEAKVHPVHVARAFRKRYGCCVGDYLRQMRVAGACRDLANSDMGMAEIAGRNGFSDQSHLCRVVKQYTGVSPSRHRRGEVRAPAGSSLFVV
jgi:AraC family transcriptional regulator